MSSLFTDALTEAAGNISITENGAIGYETSGDPLVDLNFAVSSLRDAEPSEIYRMWKAAYEAHNELALRWLFFARDVRGGLGERRLFRSIINGMTDDEHIGFVRSLVELIPEYGRWDDLMDLLNYLRKDCNAGKYPKDDPHRIIAMGKAAIISDLTLFIKAQLVCDLDGMENGEPISLLAKWLPSANTSSKATVEFANWLWPKLDWYIDSKRRRIDAALFDQDWSAKKYRKTLSKLRGYLKVTEVAMSAKDWGSIDYSKVPSKAALRYRKAFKKNDGDRYEQYITAVSKGEAKINASVTFPHEIVHRYYEEKFQDNGTYRYSSRWRLTVNEPLENLWKALPNVFGEKDCNVLTVSDASASMYSNYIPGTSIPAICVARAMSIYFAERHTGEFHNKVITFSEHPRFFEFDEKMTLADKLNRMGQESECANTNIERVFDLILDLAVQHNMSQDDLPKWLLILSDLEFDDMATINDDHYSPFHWEPNYKAPSELWPRLFKVLEKRYADKGYKLPGLIFWNICGRTETIPLLNNRNGLMCISGFSANTIKQILTNENTPLGALQAVLCTKRYDPVINAAFGNSEQNQA